MKIYQKPIISDRSSSMLKVNKDTFAELVSQSEEFFNFHFTFDISLKNSRKDPRQYDKVVITVKRKEENYSTLFSNFSSETELRISNSSISDTLQKNSLNSSTKILPSKISNKLYSGLNLIKDINKKEQFISQSTVSINSLINEAISSKYSLTELYAEEFKKNRKESRTRDLQIRNNNDEKLSVAIDTDTNRVDPSRTIDRINLELCDITYPVSEDSISRLNSESLFENPKLRMSHISEGKPSLYFDIVKYYLCDVQSGDAEDSSTWYEKRISIKSLDDISISHSMAIKKINKSSNLEVRFDLYKIGSNIIDETFSTDLFLPAHIEAYDCILNPPEVRASYSNYFQKNGLTLHAVSIVDKENSNKIQGYNIYIKTVDAQGNISPYEKIQQLKNEKINEFQVLSRSKLSVLRVIPVDSQNKESNVFTNIVLGPGYKSIGALTILPSHFGKNSIKVDVLNVPANCISLTLYRRDCTDNLDSNFKIVETIKINNITSNFSVITDRYASVGRIYEYYVIAICIDDSSKEEISVFSNFSVFRNTSGPSIDASINVDLSNPRFTTFLESPSVTFELSTSISQSENEKITQTLKEQLGELYEQFLNPATNSASPLGEDSTGIPQYSSIFFHEVVRTNLNTSERETFDLVSDGTFIDNQETQKLSNVKPINLNHSYVYQVFTYKKNPVEIFKRFVARGVDSRGKEWFYLPYKWKQPTVKLGKLYSDDNQGIPVVDAYENFTSESFGLTAQYQSDTSSQYYSIDQVNLDRIDVNTVKISWSSNEALQDILDSFVVMKVVNGIRSFVGRTCKNYIYHQLTELDLGSVYYIIVPIMSEFDIDSPAFSETIYISPAGLTPRVKLNSISSDIADESLIKINDNIFNNQKNNTLLSALKQKTTLKKI